MRKYIYIFKTELMSNLQYISNIIFGFIGYFIMIFIFLNLWKYIYSDPNELINGYNISQMIWYVIVTEILWSTVGGRKLCRKISEDVKGGNISYNINKPYSYVGYSLFSHLGNAFIKFIIYLLLGTILGYLFLNSFPNISLIMILVVLISMILATIINTLLIIFIGLVAFFIEDSHPFYWIYSKMLLVLGTIFPIEFFPKIVQPILNFSPIYVVSYGPAKLFVDFSFDSAFKIICAQAIYLIIAYGLCNFIYKKGVKRLNVNGG